MAHCYSAVRLIYRSEWLTAIVVILGNMTTGAAAEPGSDYKKTIEPTLEQFCITCHSSEGKKGGISFEFGKDVNPALDHELWLKALKMLRSGLMPPKGKERPSAEQIASLERWVKYSAFGIDPKDPDPGRVTLHRLNRTEYRNTIRDLLGSDFNAAAEFPADDTGHGFDTVADVLTLSPLLLEKYIAAAKSIVAQAVPTAPWVPATKRIVGQQFAIANTKPDGPPDGPLVLPYMKAAVAKHELKVERAGRYELVLDLTANEKYVDNQFDYNKCRLVFRTGDKVLLDQEFVRQGGKPYLFEFSQDWPAGAQEFSLELIPLTPKERDVRSLTLRIREVIVRGPMAKEHWVRPTNYERFFPGGFPNDPAARSEYIRNLLRTFATQAFRRSVDDASIRRLAKLAETTMAKPGQTPEGGVAQAMTVILASPRFLFREEFIVPDSKDRFPLLDEYSLASRLSYFLWSSMPDDELLRLAGQGKLRTNLANQVSRMLADKRASDFVRNFTGQWLQARNIDTINVNAAAVLSKDEPPDPKAAEKRARFRELIRKPAESLTPDEKKELEEARAAFAGGGRRFNQFELTGELRRAMRLETELTFDYVLRNDRSLLELLDSDYTFLNEKLAKFYGIDGVAGEQMRKVSLTAGNPRGGVLTQATVLIITSNPDRTSPVKRGLYVLENILGIPPPPPPPNITPLEQAAAGAKGKTPTLRETLKLHRSDSKCSSCHNRMDPIGLAFENFNALGRWRDKELGQPIETAGELLTGETFKSVRELKTILVKEHRLDYYRCVAEKLFIYALGRGPEPKDQHTLDEIVVRLDAAEGKPTALINGIIESPAFQRRGAPRDPNPSQPLQKPVKK
ncbi:MAG TPA: DUF1592 domain-containing protein [Gemmata sp.]|nr:DUF1592 domain-containing protein [Gemmata sp.]